MSDDKNKNPEPEISFGRDVAREAIRQMECSKDTEADHSETYNFLDECKNSGKDPVEVVKNIAEREGIDFEQSYTGKKEHMRQFLMEVLREFVRNASEVADLVDEDRRGWVEFLKEYVKSKLSRPKGGMRYFITECEKKAWDRHDRVFMDTMEKELDRLIANRDTPVRVKVGGVVWFPGGNFFYHTGL